MKKTVVMNALIALAALFVVAALGYVLLDLKRSGEREASINRRYLQLRQRAIDAREQAKDRARQEILKHGTKATVGMKRAAEKVLKAHLPKKPLTGLARIRARRMLELARKGCKSPGMPTGELTDEEREIIDVADEAVSEQDFETAQDVAAAALKSDDARVRLRAVETLTDFGEAGLPELADFLGDPHPDVAELAADRYELAVQEVESESEQVAIAKLGMLSIKDEDRLRSMAGTLIMASDELTVVSALVDVILDGTPEQAAAAKEAYESETGEEWQGVDVAEQWLRENYEPPEPEKSADENVDQEEGDTVS